MRQQRATLGEICICKLSQHIDILREARHRLQLCEQADRQIPIDLPEMDPQAFMKWCHIQLRAKVRFLLLVSRPLSFES